MTTSDVNWEASTETDSGPVRQEQPILERIEDVEYSFEKLTDKLEVLTRRLHGVLNQENAILGVVEEQDLRGLCPIEVRLATLQQEIDAQTEKIKVLMEQIRL